MPGAGATYRGAARSAAVPYSRASIELPIICGLPPKGLRVACWVPRASCAYVPWLRARWFRAWSHEDRRYEPHTQTIIKLWRAAERCKLWMVQIHDLNRLADGMRADAPWRPPRAVTNDYVVLRTVTMVVLPVFRL